jgi:hypothetical protein
MKKTALASMVAVVQMTAIQKLNHSQTYKPSSPPIKSVGGSPNKGENMSENISNGISVTTQCDDCVYLDDYNYKCRACIEETEAKLSDLAHDIVDEGNDQYKNPWFRKNENHSGSDWTASQTITGKAGKIVKMTEIWSDECHLIELSVKFLDNDEPNTTRHEFLPPIAQLIDGGELDNLWELDDYTQSKRETQCQWCNLLTPRQFNDCQACDKPLESNVR